MMILDCSCGHDINMLGFKYGLSFFSFYHTDGKHFGSSSYKCATCNATSSVDSFEDGSEYIVCNCGLLMRETEKKGPIHYFKCDKCNFLVTAEDNLLNTQI